MFDAIIPSFIAATLVTALAAPVVRALSERFGITDNPQNDSLKVHRKPMSNLGGIAVWCGFLAALAVIRMPLTISWPVLSFSSLALFFGMIDDIWWQKRSAANIVIKLILQLILAVSAVVLIISDPTRQILPALAAGILTVVIINAINMQDGFDGLLSGVIGVSAIGFLLAFVSRGDAVGAALSAILLGCALGFLTANFPPATIFLGDSGSYLIGGIVTFLLFGITADFGTAHLPGGLLLLGIPLFNLVFVVLRRMIAGRSPLVGDRLHMYDLINQWTSSQRKAVAITVSLHALFVAAGLVILL